MLCVSSTGQHVYLPSSPPSRSLLPTHMPFPSFLTHLIPSLPFSSYTSPINHLLLQSSLSPIPPTPLPLPLPSPFSPTGQWRHQPQAAEHPRGALPSAHCSLHPRWQGGHRQWHQEGVLCLRHVLRKGGQDTRDQRCMSTQRGLTVTRHECSGCMLCRW